MPVPSVRHPVRTFAVRHRATIAIALAVALVSSGTVAAVSYLVLGGSNTASTTTRLRSAVNGPVLQLINSNASGGAGARGLDIRVPAGRPPLSVNSDVKVRRLNADELDGLDASALQRRVTGVCAPGSAMTAVGAGGGVTCVPDAVDGGDAATLDGKDATAFATAPVRTFVVRSGGTALENGTALRETLAGITASATDPAAIELEPGIYDVGGQALQMKAFVDIEGSGELTTTITGAVDTFQSGTVRGQANAELRFVTVVATGGGTYATAIYLPSGTPRLTFVTARASNADVVYTIFTVGSARLTYVSATATGVEATTAPTLARAIRNSSGSPTLTNVTATASGASVNTGIENNGSSPTMVDVTAVASGGTDAYAIQNVGNVPRFTNVTARASGASDSDYGITLENSTATLSGVTIEVQAGTYAHALHTVQSNVTVVGSTFKATAAGAATARALMASAGGTITIEGSRLTASDHAVSADGAVLPVNLAATRIDGAVIAANGASVTCAGVHDEAFVFYADTCP